MSLNRGYLLACVIALTNKQQTIQAKKMLGIGVNISELVSTSSIRTVAWRALVVEVASALFWIDYIASSNPRMDRNKVLPMVRSKRTR